ncbi:hypothetical protein BV22DRAFT_966006, partial [Leucogyrophana mollusca]
PAQTVAGVRRSKQETRRVDRNRDYQWTLDEEEARKEERKQAEPEAPEVPEVPSAFAASLDPEEIFFAGVANTGPTNKDLPRDLKEALACSDGHLW